MATWKEVASVIMGAAGGDTINASSTGTYPGTTTTANSIIDYERAKNVFGLPNTAYVEHSAAANDIDIRLDNDPGRLFPMSGGILAIETEPEDGDFASVIVQNRDATNNATRVKVIFRWLKRVD